MIEFPTHKIILEVGEDRENCLQKIEISFESQISLDELLNRVFRPILIGLTYSNYQINEAFNMNEWGDKLENTPDFEDGALDPEDKDVPETENIKYDTDEL